MKYPFIFFGVTVLLLTAIFWNNKLKIDRQFDSAISDSNKYFDMLREANQQFRDSMIKIENFRKKYQYKADSACKRRGFDGAWPVNEENTLGVANCYSQVKIKL